MGFESKISGYIAIASREKESLQEVKKAIGKLPRLADDQWPFLPQDIFHISLPLDPQANPIQISYRSILVHFAMSVKQLDEALEAWIIKFENFFQPIPNCNAAHVQVSLAPYTGNYRHKQLSYFWERPAGQTWWSFKGDPRKLEDVVKSINQETFSFDEAFKAKLISSMQWIGSLIGSNIQVIDRLTTLKNNYDRHFARTSTFDFQLTHFGIRTSGTIARLEGDQTTFEFKTDDIRRIEEHETEIILDLKLDVMTTRKIMIQQVQA